MGRNAYCMRFRPVPSEGESFMASKQKILIVDDDNNIAELISLYLTKECYDTKIVNDGEELMIQHDANVASETEIEQIMKQGGTNLQR